MVGEARLTGWRTCSDKRGSMSETPDRTAKTREQFLWTRFLWLAGLLLFVIFAAAFAVVLSASNRANDVEVETGLMALDSVLSSQLSDLGIEGVEHAFWDDMVEQVEARFDPVWVENNIGAFVHETAEISLTLVFDRDDSPILYVQDGEQRASTEIDVSMEALAATFEAARNGPVDPPIATTGYLQFQDQVFFVSVVPVSPEYPAETYIGSDRPILVFGRAITPDLLMNFSTDFSLADLRCVNSTPETPSIGLKDFNGQSVGWVTWTPAQPGQTWLMVVLPILAITFVTIGTIGFMLARMWQATLRQLADQEKDIVKAMDDAIAANSAKSVFLANMSHELRTPLNAIIGFSNILKSEMFGPVGSPKYLEYVDDIHSTSNHLLEVIDAILDLAKIEAEQINLEEEVCSVSELIKDGHAVGRAILAGHCY